MLNAHSGLTSTWLLIAISCALCGVLFDCLNTSERTKPEIAVSPVSQDAIRIPSYLEDSPDAYVKLSRLLGHNIVLSGTLNKNADGDVFFTSPFIYIPTKTLNLSQPIFLEGKNAKSIPSGTVVVITGVLGIGSHKLSSNSHVPAKHPMFYKMDDPEIDLVEKP